MAVIKLSGSFIHCFPMNLNMRLTASVRPHTKRLHVCSLITFSCLLFSMFWMLYFVPVRKWMICMATVYNVIRRKYYLAVWNGYNFRECQVKQYNIFTFCGHFMQQPGAPGIAFSRIYTHFLSDQHKLSLSLPPTPSPAPCLKMHSELLRPVSLSFCQVYEN